MTENLLSAQHIQKLGHEIAEIRRRALGRVCSKYNLQLVDESNRENNKKLLTYLLNWFDFEEHPDEATVLSIVLKLCRDKTFPGIVEEIGINEILSKIGDIERKTDSSVIRTLSEIKDEILKANRTGKRHDNTDIILKQAVDCKLSIKDEVPFDSHLVRVEIPEKFISKVDEPEKVFIRSAERKTAEPLLFLPWQPLASNNNQIIIALFDGLHCIDNLTSILESSQFFKDVVLRDFPTEIFLQRPLLFRTFIELLKSNNVDVRIPVLKCVHELTKCLIQRIKTVFEPALRGKCRREEMVMSFTFETEETVKVQMHQLSCPEFGETLMKEAVNALSSETSLEEGTLIMSVISATTKLLVLIGYDMKLIHPLMAQALGKVHSKFDYFTILTGGLNSQNFNSIFANLRGEIIKNIGRPSLILNYPNLHCLLLSIISRFPESKDKLIDFEECLRICLSMEAASDCWKSRKNFTTKFQYFQALNEALISLEYHKNFDLIRDFLKVCLIRDVTDEEGDLRTNVLLKLLAMKDDNLSIELHKEILRIVKKFAGVGCTENGSANKLEFIYEDKIWNELFSFTLHSSGEKVKELCRDYIILILKSKHFTLDNVWKKLVESLIASLDLLSLYADNVSPFGRCVVRFFDPDIGKCFTLPTGEILKGNLRLLFSKDVFVNETVFSRLCFLLDVAPDSMKKLPKAGSIKGLYLSSVCAGIRPRDAANFNGSFSTPSSLEWALTTLYDVNTAAQERREALKQLAVILEDVSLHEIFLEAGGLNLLVNIMDSALVERDGSNYPDSVISVVSILNGVAKRDSAIRLELANNEGFLLDLTRSLLLFSADEVFRQNSVELLFILVFHNQVKQVNPENPYKCQLSLTNVVYQKIHVPIVAKPHNKHSFHTITSKRVEFLGNPNMSRLLRVYWATLSLGNLSTVLSLEENDLENDIISPGLPEELKLTSRDLTDLQSSSLYFVMRSLLFSVESASVHDKVTESIFQLNGCLNWLYMYKTLPDVPANSLRNVNGCVEDLFSLPWTNAFEKFLTVPPASMEDEALLSQIINLLSCALNVMKSPALLKWLTDLLTKPEGVFPTLLKGIGDSNYGIAGRNLRRNVIQLTQNVIHWTTSESSTEWILIIELLSDYLLQIFGVEQSIVAPLDWSLSLLADLTGAWTWDYSSRTKLYENLVLGVIEALHSFCGFSEPKSSFLCANMIRNALITLVNLLADGANSVQSWESIWDRAFQKVAGDSPDSADFMWIIDLTNHRDPLIRSGALTLLSKFFSSNTSYEVLVPRLGLEMGLVWNRGLSFVTDSGECAVVREKAADLLANMTGLGSKTGCKEFLIYLESENLYEIIKTTIARLDCSKLEKIIGIDPSESTTTPELVSSLSKLLLSICLLNPPEVAEKLADCDLLQTLTRSIANDGTDSKEIPVTLVSGLNLLRTCLSTSSKARDSFLSTPDVLQNICSYLDPKFRKSWSPEEADSFWVEILSLLSVLLINSEGGPRALKRALNVINEEPFLQALLVGIESPPPLEEAVISFVANLSSPELSYLFSIKLPPGGSFAILISAAMLTKNILESADAFMNLFMVSKEAQNYALKHGVGAEILLHLRKTTEALSAHILDDFRKPSGRKKIQPLLDCLETLFCLISNFCYGNPSARFCLATSGLASAVQRIWPWYGTRPSLQATVLKMLCTFTFQSEQACQSMAIFSSPPCLRISLGTVDLLHSIISIVTTEMNKKSKDLQNLTLGLELLGNCCAAVECRLVFAKSAILAPISMLLSSFKKKGKYEETIYGLWLTFLKFFTSHPEGQTCVGQSPDVMEFILMATMNSSPSNQTLSLSCLTQVSLHSTNRVRLLAIPETLLTVIFNVLQSHPEENVRLAATIIWSLAANYQKGKLVLRSAGCEQILREAKKRCSGDDCVKVIEKSLIVLGNR